MARLRSAPSTQQNAPAKPSTRQALKEKTNTTGVRASAADEIKDFVKDGRPRRGQAKKAAQNEDELVMAGGLGQRSDAQPSEPPMITDELAKSDGPPPPTARTNRRAPRQTRKPAQNEAQSKVFEDMKKRMRATAHAEAANDAIVDGPADSDNTGPSSDALPTKPPPPSAQKTNATETAERSEFSISPSPPPPGKLSAVKNKRSSIVRPESVLKSQSTPAAETSVLALKNFKRRPRQPSMLAMVQQRAASARPSAAHVQATEIEADDASVFDIDGGDEEEEEFAPDAEGTPLHLRKAKRTSVLSEKRAPSTAKNQSFAGSASAASRKRKSDGLDDSSSSVRALRAKRRKSTTPSANMSQAARNMEQAERHVSVEREETPGPVVESEVQVIHSSPVETSSSRASSPERLHQSAGAEHVVPSTEEQPENDDGQQIQLNDMDELENMDPRARTIAEPISSSPLPDEPISTQRTDVMAEPLTQVTPTRPRREQKERKAKPMMTSALQSLLPKRRQPLRPRHRKSEYDIESDSDEDEPDAAEGSDDEDADRRGRRRTKAAPAKNRKALAKSTASAAASRKSTAPSQSTRKSVAPPSRRKTATATKKAPAKTGKTYGRNAASDKENDPTNSDFEDLSDNDDSALPDTSLSMHEAATSGELAAAKAKFAEVDDWDMEFESVSFEEGRSSSQTWR